MIPLPSRTETTVQVNSGYAPSSPEESPSPTDDELGELRDPKDKLRKKRISKQQISKEAGGNIYIYYIPYVFDYVKYICNCEGQWANCRPTVGNLLVNSLPTVSRQIYLGFVEKITSRRTSVG